MKKSALILAAVATALCAGCAIHSSVSEVQKDVFTISSLGNMGQPGEELLDALYEKGVSYCEERGGKFKLLNQQTNNGTYNGNVRPFAGGPTGGTGWVGGFNAAMNSFSLPTGSYGRARIYFTCEQEQPAAMAAPAEKPALVKLIEDGDKTVYIGPSTIGKMPDQGEDLVYRAVFYTYYARPQADGTAVKEALNVQDCSSGTLVEWATRTFADTTFQKLLKDEKVSGIEDALGKGKVRNSKGSRELQPIYDYLCRRPAE